jgi:lipopolysaccharide transport system ATP-binding protein
MYVRLAFAVAAHLEPEILIVDEVLAVGDAEFQKKCLGKMQDVSTKEGRTVLFVSHHIAAISKLTSRCLVMANGSVALDGPTRNAVEAYFQAAAHEKPVSYQLQKAPRLPGGNQSATFVSAHFSRPRPLFESGEDLEFGVSLHANKNVSDLRFSMTVCSLDGTPVGTTCGRDGFEMSAGATGEFQVRLPQPRLAPGHYFCVVAIGSGFYSLNRVDFDIVADTLHFEVVTAASGANAVAYWNENWGKVVFPDVQMKATTPPPAARHDPVSTGNPMGA